MSQVGWESQIVEVAAAFADAQAGDDGACLLALQEALASAPVEVGAALGTRCPADRARQMADHDCYHDLAFALAGKAGLMVSQAPSGNAEATLVANGLFDEKTCAARTLPLAIGGALAAGLVEWSSSTRRPLASRATH